MKKIISVLLTVIILATAIIPVSANFSLLACLHDKKEVDNEAIIAEYKNNVENGIYYSGSGFNFVTIINGNECYVTEDSEFYYGGKIMYKNIATLDKEVNGTLIANHYNSAVYLDGDFIITYSFGEIVTIVNAITGNFPKG